MHNRVTRLTQRPAQNSAPSFPLGSGGLAAQREEGGTRGGNRIAGATCHCVSLLLCPLPSPRVPEVASPLLGPGCSGACLARLVPGCCPSRLWDRRTYLHPRDTHIQPTESKLPRPSVADGWQSHPCRVFSDPVMAVSPAYDHGVLVRQRRAVLLFRSRPKLVIWSRLYSLAWLTWPPSQATKNKILPLLCCAIVDHLRVISRQFEFPSRPGFRCKVYRSSMLFWSLMRSALRLGTMDLPLGGFRIPISGDLQRPSANPLLSRGLWKIEIASLLLGFLRWPFLSKATFCTASDSTL